MPKKKKKSAPADDHAPIPCPECGADIPLDPAALMTRADVTCPACGTQLTIDPSATRRGMDAWSNMKGTLDAMKALLPEG